MPVGHRPVQRAENRWLDDLLPDVLLPGWSPLYGPPLSDAMTGRSGLSPMKVGTIA
jgi:hypothetical protein